MFFKIDKLKRIDSFKFQLGTIFIEAKDEKEFLFILFKNFDLFERFVDWKYSIFNWNDKTFSGVVFEDIYESVFNINDCNHIKNLIEEKKELYMKNIKENKSYKSSENPFDFSLRKIKDIIIKKSFIRYSFFYYKNNSISRFIKSNIFDKNLINLIEEF